MNSKTLMEQLFLFVSGDDSATAQPKHDMGALSKRQSWKAATFYLQPDTLHQLRRIVGQRKLEGGTGDLSDAVDEALRAWINQKCKQPSSPMNDNSPMDQIEQLFLFDFFTGSGSGYGYDYGYDSGSGSGYGYGYSDGYGYGSGSSVSYSSYGSRSGSGSGSGLGTIHSTGRRS
jgi:hypothetical protein